MPGGFNGGLFVAEGVVRAALVDAAGAAAAAVTAGVSRRAVTEQSLLLPLPPPGYIELVSRMLRSGALCNIHHQREHIFNEFVLQHYLFPLF